MVLVFALSGGRSCRRSMFHRFAGWKYLQNRFDGSSAQCWPIGGRIGFKEFVYRPRESHHLSERIDGRMPFAEWYVTKVITYCANLSVISISGSDDNSARVWDVASGQCIRILSHRGPLTNAFYAPRFKHLETDKFLPSVIINTFEKKRHDGPAAESELSAQVLIRHPPLMETDEKSSAKVHMDHSDQQNEFGHLINVNRQLYSFHVDNIFNKTPAGSGGKKRK